ncbi:hypothetical protein TIFTF001_013432 [Ficus carica]|uniref:Cyclic nucleotide-binding domain-containing protein n=1 Tax=Ficus carica TaxID=3494 RepID=A0AA88AE98_FICCA|nr:hypothetical protein TIFTF001_013432 [Ficus carica]
MYIHICNLQPKRQKIRVKINDKQPEIESYLSNHDLPKPKQKLILRYLGRTVKQGKDVDVKHLFSLLEEHIENSQRPHHEHNEGFAEWVTKILDEEKHEKDTKEQQAELWMENSKIPDDMRSKITQYVRLRMREGKDVDVRSLLSVIPSKLGLSVKKHLCFPILKKVPMLENMDEKVYNTIYSYLKPVVYQENSFIIRKGEPLDLMLFITQGVVWSFGSSSSPMERL